MNNVIGPVSAYLLATEASQGGIAVEMSDLSITTFTVLAGRLDVILVVASEMPRRLVDISLVASVLTTVVCAFISLRTLIGTVAASVIDSDVSAVVSAEVCSDISVTTLIVLNGISVIISVVAFVLIIVDFPVFSITSVIAIVGDSVNNSEEDTRSNNCWKF